MDTVTNNEIDWNKAPEGATHYNIANGYWYRTSSAEHAGIMRSSGEWEESLFATKELDISLHFFPRPVPSEQPVSTSAETTVSTETHSIVVKPPLGLTPKNIWEEQMQHQRRQDIHAAMQRYIEAGKEIPNEWLYELVQLNLTLQKIETDFSEAIQTLPASDEGFVEWGKEEEPDIAGNTFVEKVYSDGDTENGYNSDYKWFGSPGLDGKPYVVTRYRIISEGEQE